MTETFGIQIEPDKTEKFWVKITYHPSNLLVRYEWELMWGTDERLSIQCNNFFSMVPFRSINCEGHRLTRAAAIRRGKRELKRWLKRYEQVSRSDLVRIR